MASMKMHNFVRDKISENGYAVGAFVASGSLMNCECLGANGMDFIIIDTEHAQTDCETIVHMSCASELYGMAAFVRVCNPADTTMMARLLDVGVHGLMVPMVETRQQAEEIIRAVKFPPLGMRGANGGRGARWGLYEHYSTQANDSLYTILQCESRTGVENIREIARTAGVDCIFVGTADLAQDMGHPGDLSNPEVMEVVSHILSVCQECGVVAGIVAGSVEAAIYYLQQGFRFVTCMNDQVFFRTESGKRLQAIRNGVRQQM